jgi:hypothetical protein
VRADRRDKGIMKFAIKAEIPDPHAKAFSLVAQKTM